jgi:PAS domain S-box-containing protein
VPDDHSLWEPSKAYLRLFIGIVLVSDLLFIASIVLYAPAQMMRVVGPVVLAVIVAAAAWRLRSGNVKSTIRTLTYGVWLVVTGIAIANGGLRTPIVYAYPVIILGVGLMTNARAAFMTTAATALVIVLLMAGEMAGMLRTLSAPTPVMFAVVQISVCLMAAALIGSVVKSYQMRLRELGELGKSLTVRTHHLEESRLQLQQAQSVAKVGSWIMTFSRGEFDLSTEARRILGLPGETPEMVSAVLQKVAPPDRDLFAQAMQSALDGKPFDFEMRLLDGDATAWVRMKADVQTGVDGAALYVVGIVQDITERKQAEMRIQTLAYFDELTGLPNRRLLMDRLAHAMSASLRHPRAAALIFVDLDNFKVLNDTHSHFIGDLLLQQVGMRLVT